MFASRRGTGHPLLFALLLAVAVYAIVAGTIAMNTDGVCPAGWDRTWRLLPPEWECRKDAFGD